MVLVYLLYPCILWSTPRFQAWLKKGELKNTEEITGDSREFDVMEAKGIEFTPEGRVSALLRSKRDRGEVSRGLTQRSSVCSPRADSERWQVSHLEALDVSLPHRWLMLTLLAWLRWWLLDFSMYEHIFFLVTNNLCDYILKMFDCFILQQSFTWEV